MTDSIDRPESVREGHTPGPWFVRDFRASEMRRLGWDGPSVDRILIVNKTGPEIIESAGENCVIARIQFDNRREELGAGNIADAHLLAAAPDLLAALQAVVRIADRKTVEFDAARAAISKALGNSNV